MDALNIRSAFITVLAVLFFTGYSHAIPVEEWNMTFAGSGNTSAIAVMQTSDGGYVFAGATCYNQRCSPWLVRTDALGNEQWNRTFRDIYGARAIMQTPDGGYVMAGARIFRTDAGGLELWNRSFSGTFNSVIRTPDGGYIGAGAVNTETGDYHPDGWLIKMDDNGIEQWNRTFRGNGFGYLNSVLPDIDGGFVLAGYRRGYENESGAWLIKVNEIGIELWNRTFGEWNASSGGRGLEAYSVEQTGDGGYILAGYGLLLIKTDAGGNMQWGMNRTFKGKDTAVARSVQIADGGYVIPVTAQLYGGFNKESWLIKVDDNGSERWNVTLGGQNSEARSVRRTNDGGYVIAGLTYTGPGGSGTGGSYAWLAKVREEQTAPEEISGETPASRAEINDVATGKVMGFEAVLLIPILLAVYAAARNGKGRR